MPCPVPPWVRSILAPESDRLSGPEIVLLIEALDAMIPFTEETRYLSSKVDRHTWRDQDALRQKLKQAVGMSFYDHAKGWLDGELRREREAVTERLFSRLSELMHEPGATRRTVREGFVAMVREVKETRQSNIRPLS